MQALRRGARAALPRSFTLSRELDGGRIEAQLKDGVLRLRIPKQEHAQRGAFSIKVA